ncbi:DUF3307 domain-containing protein [Kitasatospora sp. NPDC057692]|uniref:DUF3307 domain-containing protein n=1 Tax=Kitasatospora sp. NPDC057692 TaxID=3346215 RepID=UPI00369031EE
MTSTFAATFILLYIAHLTADYALQTDHQAAHKALPGWAGWRANLFHAAVHIGAAAALLRLGAAALGLHPTTAALAVAYLWLGTTHAIIDRRWPVLWWMRTTGSADYIQHGGAAHVDQTAHIALGLLPAALALTRL